jgi:nitroreductase
MFNDRSSLLAFLSTRRSCRPRDLVEPGPDAEQLSQIIALASRTPDHGKLHPWRFVHIPRSARAEFAALLHRAYKANNPDPGRLEIEASEKFAHQAPELIVVVSAPRVHKIPVWEQELSCGAACMNLLSAAAALGFCGGWVTGWATYSEVVREGFCGPGERLAGFIFIGTAGAELEERDRPALDQVMQEWHSPRLAP